LFSLLNPSDAVALIRLEYRNNPVSDQPRRRINHRRRIDHGVLDGSR
jgi:hypothetical protein